MVFSQYPKCPTSENEGNQNETKCKSDCNNYDDCLTENGGVTNEFVNM